MTAGKHTYVLILLASCAVACSAVDAGLENEQDAPAADAADPGSSDDEAMAVGMLGEALGTTEQCATLAADVTVSGGGNDWIALNTYDHTNCKSGYLVDLNDFVPYVSDPSAPSWPASVGCGEALAPTEGECEGLRLLVYVWERVGQSTTFVGSSIVWGLWNGNNCVSPTVFINTLGATAGDDLRIAAGCYKHQLPNNGSSVFFRRQLHLQL